MHDFSVDARYFDGEWHIDVYKLDKRNEWLSHAEGPSLSDSFHHAMYEADPLKAALFFPSEYYRWSEQHTVEFSEQPAPTVFSEEPVTCPDCGKVALVKGDSYYCDYCGIGF